MYICFFGGNINTWVAPNPIKCILLLTSQSSVIFSHSVLTFNPPPKATNTVVTFEIIVWHIKEALRGMQPTKSRKIKRRLELGNRKLEVESIPVFLSTLLPIVIQMQLWMLRQNRHTIQRNFGLCIYIIIIHFGLNFYVGEIFLNNFVMLTLTSSISNLQTK